MHRQNERDTENISIGKYKCQLHDEPQVIDEVCQICYIKYSKLKMEEFRPALICYDCWYQHVKTNVTKISYMVGSSLISPFESESQIDICIALNGLKRQHKVQLEELLYKKYTTFTKDIEKCPSQTCDFVFTMQKCKWSTGLSHLCLKCQTPLSVQNTTTLKSVLGLVYFIFLANKCPKCSIPIERVSGCPHMTCPCGHEFCWFCLKDHIQKINNLYTIHEPKECASIFLSKIIILLACLMSLSCFLVGGKALRKAMEGLFVLLIYIIHCILIDLWILAEWTIYNIYKNQPGRNLPLQRSKKYVQMLVWFIVNLIFVVILYGLDLLYTTLVIVVIEGALAGLVSTTVYAIIFNIETWFDFIN